MHSSRNNTQKQRERKNFKDKQRAKENRLTCNIWSGKEIRRGDEYNIQIGDSER